MQNLEEQKPAKYRFVFVGSMIFIVASTASLAVLQFGSGAYKQWAGAIFMGLLGSLIAFRCLQEFIGNRVVVCIPYILATFFALSFVASFTPSNVSLVVWTVYVILAGIAGFYWLIHIIVDAVKSFPLPREK